MKKLLMSAILTLALVASPALFAQDTAPKKEGAKKECCQSKKSADKKDSKKSCCTKDKAADSKKSCCTDSKKAADKK